MTDQSEQQSGYSDEWQFNYATGGWSENHLNTAHLQAPDGAQQVTSQGLNTPPPNRYDPNPYGNHREGNDATAFLEDFSADLTLMQPPASSLKTPQMSPVHDGSQFFHVATQESVIVGTQEKSQSQERADLDAPIQIDQFNVGDDGLSSSTTDLASLDKIPSSSLINIPRSKCPTCGKNLQNSPAVLLRCEHLICQECLDPWLQTQQHCPICAHSLAPLHEVEILGSFGAFKNRKYRMKYDNGQIYDVKKSQIRNMAIYEQYKVMANRIRTKRYKDKKRAADAKKEEAKIMGIAKF